MKPYLKLPVVVFIILLSFIIFSGCISQNSKLVENEIVNQTYNVGGKYEKTVIPLSPGTYELIGRTTQRDSPEVEILVEYSYWVYSNITDKFGIKNTSYIATNQFILGMSNDNTDVNRVFSIPSNAISANVLVCSIKSTPNYPWDKKEVSTFISIRTTIVPEAPIPPSVGSIVNCSRYTELVNDRTLPWNVLQPGILYSSDGESHFMVPGNPDYRTFRNYGYSWYAEDKYTSYVFPANLSVLNKTQDLCKVIP